MGILSAIFLGAVQGITEFLPISSTGHLILARSLIGISDSHALAFDAMLHLATASAVIVYFYEEIWVLVQTVMRKLGRQPIHQKNMTMVNALILGTLPAVVFGLSLESFMETVFRNPLLVAAVLVAGSGLFIYAEYKYQNSYHEQEVSPKMGLKIGFFQSLALIPGVSRSGASISGGMLLGLTRVEATRFAFLLAVPVILGAGAKKILELLSLNTAVVWTPIIVGAIVAFVVGLLAIHFMIKFVGKHTLWPFIWYRIILAGFVVFIYFFG